jgi:hypothetical protein
MAAVALDRLTTAQLLDELELRLQAARTGANGAAPEHTIHWRFSAAGEGATAPHILRVRMELAGLNKGSFATAFGVAPESVEEWLAGSVPVPAWVLPAIRMYEMLSASARQKVLRTPAARAGKRPGNTHPFACIEEL